MRAELTELHRRLGATMIYVTHDQSEAMTMSDRVAVMLARRAAAGGAAGRQLYDDPETLPSPSSSAAPRSTSFR